MARLRRPVLGVWMVVLAACAVAYPVLEGRLGAPDFSVHGSESSEVDKLMAKHFPQIGAEQDVIVFESEGLTTDDVEYRKIVDRTVEDARRVSGVSTVIGPYSPGASELVSRDRRVSIATVGLDGDMVQRAETAEELQAVVERAAGGAAVRAAVTGYSPVQNDVTAIQNADLARAEAVGIPVALLLLVLALGAIVAAIVPIAVALAGLLLATGILLALTTLTVFDSLVIAMATMIGIGVGIDYAMFVVSRFREELSRAGIIRRDDQPGIADAVGRSLATAGKTILTSGLIVIISLCSLIVMRAPIFRGIAVGVATAVVATLVVGLTLLPALLATLGPAVNNGALPRRWRSTEVTEADARSGRWARWAYTMMRRPITFGALAVGVLLLAATPLLGIRYGLDMRVSALDDTPSGRASTTLAANFAPGALSPVEIAASGPGDTPLTAQNVARLDRLMENFARDTRIDTVVSVGQSGGRQLFMAVPNVAFDSTAAGEMIRNLRNQAAAASRDGGPVVLIGGSTAEFVDIADEMTGRLPLVVGLVLILSLLFLIVAFRSIVLPVKAILMNLLATGAALGITVAVFQWGLGESLLDFTSPGFLQVYLPTVVFVILFGLSMDYEVFLIRRIREYWESTGNNQDAVAAGITHTARPITAAAAIMVVVFGCFVTADILELKQLGLALAVAVAIDAVLVRLILVPALMRLFGDWNWWLPHRFPRLSRPKAVRRISEVEK